MSDELLDVKFTRRDKLKKKYEHREKDKKFRTFVENTQPKSHYVRPPKSNYRTLRGWIEEDEDEKTYG